ncbi:hypothetical protein HNQ02_001387 [Flavobacterium sp. 7E]|uniref:T9SS type A sorting domain-containing protein n=1 Tax=Flavobacterium sp. 7E TaxID=2735898 RepID=UPI00156EA807|nr:T9SS type A sorting domain-containing protein [Flavobacterium sp. 7E]NRS88473.1 hypothetical protein [Flavobacterium sp. 7E]
MVYQKQACVLTVGPNSAKIALVKSIVEENDSESKIKFYPNPVIDVFTFDINKNEIGTKSTATIYDSSGMFIQSFVIDASNPSISLKSLKPGIYLFYIEGLNKTFSTKFIKE